MESRGGVLLRVEAGSAGLRAGGLLLVPSGVADRVAALSAMTPVRGLQAPGRGIALADGEVVTVLSLASTDPAAPAPAPPEPPRYKPDSDWPVPGAHHAVICRLDGTIVALTGGTLVATGVFEVSAHGEVVWRGEPVATLDVRALYAQAEAAIWAARAVSAEAARCAGAGGAEAP